jgi:predicted mannosyl-3-phosphoglycerate phosphatase (HAD superfamily)
MLLSLGVFRTAMFAEPAVTEIEEVVGLIQSQKPVTQKSEYRSRTSDP